MYSTKNNNKTLYIENILCLHNYVVWAGSLRKIIAFFVVVGMPIELYGECQNNCFLQ